jgi:hypothetical protein
MNGALLVWMGGVGLAAAPKPSLSEHPTLSHTPANPDHVRILVVGDTGVVHPDTAGACGEVGTSCKLSAAAAEAFWAQVGSEDVDALFLPGDLVYGPRYIESAPKCRSPEGKVREDWLDPALGDKVRDLGVPVYLALGNHDVAHRQRSRARERCILRYAATEDALVLPQLQYSVDFGLLDFVVLNTNVKPERWDAGWLSEHSAADRWTLMGGHHVIRTKFDKEGEHAIREWLVAQDLRPDLWLNGHAHFLQFGVYDDIPALTSGAGAKVRVRPECPGDDCTGPDAPLYAESRFGYAIIDATPQTLRVSVRDDHGAERFCWERTRQSPAGQACTEASSPTEPDGEP